MNLGSAFQACNRFGLGARPGDLAKIAPDPKGWLLQQLRTAFVPPEITASLDETAIQRATSATMGMDKPHAELAAIYGAQTATRFLTQMNSDQPLIERMVMFWSNHFTVSVQKSKLASFVNRYEANAIRPYVTGYFKDMLIAVVQHPAMLFYLDNVQSIGPNSVAGEKRQRGLNENLGREILELHTLGVNGGYSQDDVIALSKMITGWTINAPLKEDDGTGITFEFNPRGHEPGAKTLLGKTFAENGEQEGIDALTFLAQHPATANHIATKLARQFLADDPPASAVKTIAASFTQSGGHLPTVMQTIINLPDPWKPLTKYKTTYEFALSALRLTGADIPQEKIMHALHELNFRPFDAPSPAGYDDTAAAWASPDAVMKRIEWAHTLAQKLPAATDPIQLAEASIGPVMSVTTRQTIERAASGADGVALLLVSPEFQRR